MKFIPRKPREGINVSDVHPLAEAGALVAGLSIIFTVVAVALFYAVELALLSISVETEVQLFENWAPDDLLSVSADDERKTQAQEILRRLVAHWGDAPYQFRLEIVESDVPNAMAYPGGLIVVTTELLDGVASENELAFVLGHELGHFRNRDHLRMLGRVAVIGLVFVAATGTDGGAALGVRIADIAQRSFSRGQESAADEFGLQVVNAEYGHVDHSWNFFDRLNDGDLRSSKFIAYLSTHPSAADRSDRLKVLAHDQGWPLSGPTIQLNWINISSPADP